MTIEGMINAQRAMMKVLGIKLDEEPASWVTINGNHIPLNEEGRAIGGNPKALGEKPKSRFGQGRRTVQKKELSEEQKKKNAERAAARERMRAQQKAQEAREAPDTSYQIRHRPPTIEDVKNGEAALASDLSNIVPEDIYEHPEWYCNISEKADRESVAILKKIRNNPDAVVTIYRGAPKGELNDGDWVSLSKTYASEYAGEGAYSSEGSTVHVYKVKASQLTWAGDSINEFGYRGEPLVEDGEYSGKSDCQETGETNE